MGCMLSCHHPTIISKHWRTHKALTLTWPHPSFIHDWTADGRGMISKRKQKNTSFICKSIYNRLYWERAITCSDISSYSPPLHKNNTNIINKTLTYLVDQISPNHCRFSSPQSIFLLYPLTSLWNRKHLSPSLLMLHHPVDNTKYTYCYKLYVFFLTSQSSVVTTS